MADVVALGRADVDLSDPAACAAAINAYRPRAVINAAAYTAVDRAEEEEALATTINGEAPTAMAGACAHLTFPLCISQPIMSLRVTAHTLGYLMI